MFLCITPPKGICRLMGKILWAKEYICTKYHLLKLSTLDILPKFNTSSKGIFIFNSESQSFQFCQTFSACGDLSYSLPSYKFYLDYVILMFG